MKRVGLVALGGVIGSLLRFLLSEGLPNYPLAIFAANVLGVFIAGWSAYRLTVSADMRAFLIAGVAGGMTTFSSVALVHAQQNSLLAIAYFYGLISISLVTLYICKPRVAK